MKKTFYILLSVLALSSCAHLMDTKPSTEVDKSMILNDVESMKVAMNGVYSTMYNRIDFVTANAHQCFGNMAVTLAADLMGEDMVQTAQGAGWFYKDYCYEQRQRYTAKIWRCYFTWTYFYQIIGNCNYILSSVPTVKGNANEIKNVAAQAYAARAFSYFMLIQSFQQTLVGHETLPGVPIYTEPTVTGTEGKGRGTVQDVYNQINSDINTALTLFEESKIKREHISHLDFASTHLLRARVALVENDWAKAEASCKKVIEQNAARLLSREEATVTQGTFNNANKSWVTGKTPFNTVSMSSILWGAQVLSEQCQVYASFYSHMDAATNVYYAAEAPKCISNWLYQQISATDVRKGWWNGDIGVTTEDWSYGANINYNQHKFQWADQKAYLGDYIFMRLEEVYIVLAEALCRQEKYEEARDAIWEVISRRDSFYLRPTLDALTGNTQTFASVGTVTTLLDFILLQRRIELWGETGRIFDILRLGKGWTRYWELPGGEKSNHTNYLSKYAEYLHFPADYLECILMIPQVEIDNNPNINADDQNPYIQ